MKKIPLRRCLVTGEILPKKDLLRIVKTPEGKLVIDPTGKLNGHGAYIRKGLPLVVDAKLKKSFDHAFKTKVDDEFYEHIKTYLAQ